jgi:hypothetical protein
MRETSNGWQNLLHVVRWNHQISAVEDPLTLEKGMFTFDPEGTITWANSKCEFHSRVQIAEYVGDLPYSSQP